MASPFDALTSGQNASFGAGRQNQSLSFGGFQTFGSANPFSGGVSSPDQSAGTAQFGIPQRTNAAGTYVAPMDATTAMAGNRLCIMG